MRGKELAVAALAEAPVYEQYRPVVGSGADNAAGRLQDAIHAGVGVGVFETRYFALVEVVADQVAFKADLWQSDAHNHGTD